MGSIAATNTFSNINTLNTHHQFESLHCNTIKKKLNRKLLIKHCHVHSTFTQ